jgi:para-nitrobenzyl esterase
VWAYSFDWRTPIFGGRLMAFHALDVPFAFDTIDLVGSTDRSPAAHTLATAVSSTWATFARAGKPDNATIPAWPAYTQATRDTLIFDTAIRIERDPRSETRRLWQDITGTA